MTPQLQRWSRAAGIAGFVGLAVCAIGLFFANAATFRAYWFAWVFWSGAGFGSLALLLMQFLTGGDWTKVTQRPAEAGTATLPLMALLLVPALFGLRQIFPWANPQLWAGHAWPHKQAWLTPMWFVLRSLVYFAVLIGVAFLARTWLSLRRAAGPLQALGAGGLILYVLCMNFASLDWVMSLEPEWSSTIFAVVFMIGQFLVALGIAVALVMTLGRAPALIPLLDPKVHRDLGNLLLAFVMFWAYVSFSQFLIIWSGNLPREIGWYLHREGGGWGGFAVFLALVQFFVPFALLLSRAAKQHRQTLGPIAILIVAANSIAVFWQIAPSYYPGHFHIGIFDVAAFVGVGGIWSAAYLRSLSSAPLVPVPLMDEEVAHV